MSRAQYIAIAGIFNHTLKTQATTQDQRRAVYFIIQEFCKVAYKANNRFRKDYFMTAVQKDVSGVLLYDVDSDHWSF